jgi:hypothetical protein
MIFSRGAKANSAGPPRGSLFQGIDAIIDEKTARRKEASIKAHRIGEKGASLSVHDYNEIIPH